MSKLVLASLAFLSLAAVATPSFATHSDCDDPPYLDLGGVYFDLQHADENHFYIESGVMSGLQRGSVPIPFYFTGTHDTAIELGLFVDCPVSPATDYLIL